MKPDGATMETSEPDQAAEAHRPPQEAATEEGQPAAAAAQKANGKPVAVDPKARLKAGGNKVQPSSTGVAGSGSRPGTASHRAEKDAKPSSAGRKAAGSASAAGAAPNRAAGAKNQTRALDRRPVKTSSLPDAAASNGTKPRGPNGAAKRAPAQAANGAKPKTIAPKSNNSTKPAAPAASKTTTTTTRPAAGSLTSRSASTVPKPAAAAKPSNTATAKVSRAAAPPPAGRTAAVQPSKHAPAAKKDVSRPPPAARKPVAAAAAEPPAARKPVAAAAAEPPAARKPVAAAAAGLPASKKNEASKSANAAKPNSAPKAATATKAAAPKVQPPAKPAATKKPPTAARLPLASRAPGRTPPASPAGRPAGAFKPVTPATKRGARPPQTGSPFTKKTSNPPVTEVPPQRTAASAPAADPAAPTEKPESAAVEEVQTRGDGEPEEVGQHEEAAPPPPPTPPPEQPPQQEQTTVAPSGAPPKEPGSPDQTPAPPAASFAPKTAPLNLNEEEEEEEEEREGSQLVSVSEMSGTTQPTEESRPGSGGPVGGAAWKAGGVWLSELDSEEVSGSQQGASELSAPGVLEGTESTDELGDGSLKGAMDMEGASAGSPDFEKVPDIPVNEDDDSDRVCDMEVGSERTDEPRGPRHDDVDEEDDEDVEMASEGVTESGLESYGNADEDDFADEERLDNLNRVVQPPLPPAPAAQWDQQNPSDCRWAGPSQLCLPQGPEGEPEAQAWSGGGASASAPEGQDVPLPPQTADPRGPAAAPGPSPSSEASTPEDRHQERKLSSPAFEAPPHSSQEVQTEREEEAEPETLPADEVLGGPSTAPTSNPSSSSVTEDEASDTEGEAQLGASSAICNLTFDPIPPPQRCLSTVEEEAERAPGDEAASPASFILDSNTTPSTKSPGIFSLEELPVEANKEPYMEAGRQEAEPDKQAGPERRESKEPLEEADETTDVQPQYYAICEKTDDSFPGNV